MGPPSLGYQVTLCDLVAIPSAFTPAASASTAAAAIAASITAVTISATITVSAAAIATPITAAAIAASITAVAISAAAIAGAAAVIAPVSAAATAIAASVAAVAVAASTTRAPGSISPLASTTAARALARSRGFQGIAVTVAIAQKRSTGQPDPSGGVNFDYHDGNIVSDLHLVLDRRHTVVGKFADVNHAVFSGKQFDESSEVRGADDLAGVYFAYLNLAG